MQRAAVHAQAPVEKIPWGLLLSKPAVWALIICHFCHNWGTFILLTWMPSYYNQVCAAPWPPLGAAPCRLGPPWHTNASRGSRAALQARVRHPRAAPRGCSSTEEARAGAHPECGLRVSWVLQCDWAAAGCRCWAWTC